MNNIIVMYEDIDKELNISLYDFIDELYNKRERAFLVSHIEIEEYEEMRKQLKNGFLYERLASTTKDELKYNKFRYLMASNKNQNNISIADYNEPDKKGNYTIDKNGISYNEDKLQFSKDPIVSRQVREIRVYTTETYDDVIAHYQNVYKKTPSKSKFKVK